MAGDVGPRQLEGACGRSLPEEATVGAADLQQAPRGALRQDLAKFALEMQGAAGVARDPGSTELAGGFQANWLASPGLRLAGGTDEILRNIVAERVLGLPAEARADKGIAFKDIPTRSN